MDPTKKELYTAKRPSGLNVSNPDVAASVGKLRSDQENTNWLLFTVATGGDLAVHGCGEGGFAELHSKLTDDDIFFGAIKCKVQQKVKFYHVFFVGGNVGGMKKGKASMYKSAIFALIDAHGEISCSDGLAEFTVDSAVAAVCKLAGCAPSDVLL